MLLKFFSNKKNTAYLRSLATEFGESTNSIRVELNNLSDAGYLTSAENGRTIEYQANTKHPLYPELKSLTHKYLGLDKIAENVVQKLGKVYLAFLTGDYANGKDTGIIDLVVVGEIDRKKLRGLCLKAEKLIKRKIRTLVLTLEEFEGYKGTLEVERALWLWGEESLRSEV
jgi:hypothetical protein